MGAHCIAHGKSLGSVIPHTPVTPLRTLQIFAPLDEPEAEAVAHAARVAGYEPSAVRVTVVRRSLDARKGHPIGFHLEVVIWPADAPSTDERGGAAAAAAGACRCARDRRRHRAVRHLCGVASHRRRRACHPRRHRQARAAAPSRSGGAHAARRPRSRLQLLLRRRRRRHLFRRQALHAHQGPARGAKRFARPRAPMAPIPRSWSSRGLTSAPTGYRRS